VTSKKLKKCSEASIAKTCQAAKVSAKEDADHNCYDAGSFNPGCTCNGQYYTSQCNVVHNDDRSCYVTSSYEYAGVCDGVAGAPTAAPSSAVCPDKECRGQNAAYVFKAKGECKSSILNKVCLKSKLTTKMNADLECKSDQCVCQGEYTGARCFSVPVNEGSATSVLRPYCYYFAKYKYEGYCASPMLPPPW
jgi:hypothetical protein